MDEKKLKYVVIVSLFIIFALSLITGIIKFPGLFTFLGIDYTLIPLYQINLIHDWSGLALIILIIVHIILNREWITSLIPGSLRDRVKAWHLIVAFLIIITLILVFYIQNQVNPENRIKQLEGIEIREYQGENLSSFKDVQETGIKGVQYIDINNYYLEISGLVREPQKYTYDQVLSLPHYSKVVELQCVVGWKAKILWEGVLVKDLLEKAGVDHKANTVIFYAVDGFTTSLPLDFILDKNIILAYKMNDIVIPPEKGFPFQLIAEQKWGYKWIKWLTKIELSDDIDYRGTYESSGYSNDADVGGPKIEAQ